MANIVLDFLHNYQTGERRETEPANAYQFDEGHVLEAVLPEVITACEIHYWIRGMEEADAYTPTSITPNSDGSCTVLGNIPNSYFETNGELRIYIVVTDGTASITTYEGKLHICQRSMPDDYVDDDPDNDAVQIIAAARGYAETSEAWAVGQINGEDVPSTADQYQNNASYYAGQAASAASSAAAQASLAPAYDNTATYAVGDYCLHDGQLYECTTAIATAEAWTAAHWTAVTVGGELSTLKDDLYNTLVTDTASGAIASFPDGADNVPVKSLTVDIEPIQSGSGDPSPDNVRPISGHTQAVVTVSPTTDAEDGTTYTIDLDGTRYGGTLDVTTGVLTVDMKMVDMGALNWYALTTAGYFRAAPLDLKPNGNTILPKGFCSCYKVVKGNDIDGTDLAITPGMNNVNTMIVHDTTHSDIASFNAFVTGQQLVYELATPTTVQLDAQEVRTLLAQNNVFADCGDVSVKYRADTKLYIQKVING